MLFNFFYSLVLFVIAILAFPKFCYSLVLHGKYRNSLLQRFGFGFPRIEKGSRQLIWVHAVSLGETKAAAGLVKKIKQENPEFLVLCSSVTETGHQEAKKNIPEADYHVFLPLDFSWIVKPILRRVKPNLLIICETDFWYNLIRFSKLQGARVVAVNAKLSERSLGRYLHFSWFAKRLFSLIDFFCVQSTLYKERFLALGIPKEKLSVTGNMKFDASPEILNEEALSIWRKKFGLDAGSLVFVVGSTHHPEERLILESLLSVWEKIPQLFVILVPRHPERFEEVDSLLTKMQIPFCRYRTLPEKREGARVLLIDAMGLLKTSYQLADFALVAGSFVKEIGGHNIMEPCFYGVPVLYGPLMHSQPELVDWVHSYGAGEEVAPEGLSSAILELCCDIEKRKTIGIAGKKMTSELKGTVEKTYNAIYFQKKIKSLEIKS